MSYHSESSLQPINKKMYFLNACRISGYFDTKITTIVQIEPSLQKSEDPKIDNILNLERVYFLMTRVNYHNLMTSLKFCEKKPTFLQHIW